MGLQDAYTLPVGNPGRSVTWGDGAVGDSATPPGLVLPEDGYPGVRFATPLPAATPPALAAGSSRLHGQRDEEGNDGIAFRDEIDGDDLEFRMWIVPGAMIDADLAVIAL